MSYGIGPALTALPLIRKDNMKRAKKLKAKINSRQKGAQGEREFAAVLKAVGLEARRGQQFSGGKESPDVICPALTNVHFEVKRVQAGNLYTWLAQAQRDGVGKVPVVAHRRNQKDWVAVLPMSDLLNLLILREGHML